MYGSSPAPTPCKNTMGCRCSFEATSLRPFQPQACSCQLKPQACPCQLKLHVLKRACMVRQMAHILLCCWLAVMPAVHVQGRPAK
jgi:hypothetical protein